MGRLLPCNPPESQEVADLLHQRLLIISEHLKHVVIAGPSFKRLGDSANLRKGPKWVRFAGIGHESLIILALLMFKGQPFSLPEARSLTLPSR